jgi:hypothetical protein
MKKLKRNTGIIRCMIVQTKQRNYITENTAEFTGGGIRNWRSELIQIGNNNISDNTPENIYELKWYRTILRKE